MMTVWRADAKTSLQQEKEIGGEHIDIPGWKLATALNIPTGMALRLKKSLCELVNALLEWYLTERDPEKGFGSEQQLFQSKDGAAVQGEGHDRDEGADDNSARGSAISR